MELLLLITQKMKQHQIAIQLIQQRVIRQVIQRLIRIIQLIRHRQIILIMLRQRLIQISRGIFKLTLLRVISLQVQIMTQ